MSKKTNKIFLKKQIKNLKKKKKFNFKLEQTLEYIKILKILNNSSILIFFQFISLNSEKDQTFYSFLLDKNFLYTFLKKKYIKKIFDVKIIKYIKNFNNILSINNLLNLKNLEKILLEKSILILGYYFQNILFFKKDLTIKNINKKEIYYKIMKFKFLIQKIILNLIILLKHNINKIYFILKKKKNLWQQ